MLKRLIVAVFVAAFTLLATTPSFSQAGGQPIQCTKSVIYNNTTSGSTELVALVSGKAIYVCGFTFFSGGTSSVKLIRGTGTACATGSADVTPAFPLTAQVGVVDPSTYFRGLGTSTGDALCINSSAGVSVQAIVYYSQF